MPHPDMHTNDGHPDEGLLHEWLDDQLSPVDAADMQSHIASCAACGARVAEARGLIAASRRILSALDDVPLGVIPVSISIADVARGNTVPSEVVAGSLSKRVASPERVVTLTRENVPKRVVPWRRIGSIAALLLVSVTVLRYAAPGYNATAPMASTPGETVSAAPAATEPSALAAPGVQNSAAVVGRADRIADFSAAMPKAGSPPAAEAATEKRAAPSVSKPLQAASDTERAKKTVGSVVADAAPTGLRLRGAGAIQNSDSMAAGNRSAPARPAAPVPAQSRDAAASATLPATAPGTVAASVASAPPPVVADQTAMRTSPGAAGGGGGGRAGGGRGGRAASSVPATIAGASSAGSVSGASTRIDSTGKTRAAESEAALAQARRGDSSARVATVSPQRADAPASFAARMLGNPATAAIPIAAFDSVTLIRTNCSPACDTAALHINALGVVRYVVGSGNTQRVVMSQLSADERARLAEALLRAFPDRTARVGNTSCVIPSRGAGVPPAVRLTISFPAAVATPAESRCSKSSAEIEGLGVSIDSLSGVEGLKRRVSPVE